MTATVLPLKEVLTTESSTSEGSKNYGIRFYLLQSGSFSKLRRNQDRVTQASGPEYHIRGCQKTSRTVGQTLIIVAHLQWRQIKWSLLSHQNVDANITITKCLTTANSWWQIFISINIYPDHHRTVIMTQWQVSKRRPHSSPACKLEHHVHSVWSLQCRSVFMNLLSGAEYLFPRMLAMSCFHNITA